MAIDRAYTNLLAHLQQPSPSLPLQTVISAISHYLSQLPLPHPTQLTACIISSSLWQPLSVESVWPLATAFRSAFHLKKSKLEREPGGWFSKDPATLLGEWITAILKGTSRGDARLRIPILGGVLLGLEDLSTRESRNGVRESLEGQIVVDFAEVLETMSMTDDAWRNEFTVRESPRYKDASEALFLYSACHILLIVASAKLNALYLPGLIELARKGIRIAFVSGEFLSCLPLSTTRNANGQIAISSESSLVNSLQAVNKHSLYKAIGPLAKLLSRCLSLLAETTPGAAFGVFHSTSAEMKSMASTLEADWRESIISGVTSDNDIEPQTKEVCTEIWRILKTFLFVHLMVSHSILSPLLYLPHPITPSDTGPSETSQAVLRTLHHLAFVLSRFGGVTSSAEGFKELKRVFYMALDIIAADPDPDTSISFIKTLISETRDPQRGSGHPFHQSRTAYTLAVIEQLVSVVGESVIETDVVPYCLPCLDDTEHRESYESAHSAMLAIFAAHAEQAAKGETAGPNLAERLVPLYVDSLIKNSHKGRLSATQLKLAYSSLVRSAAARGDDALTWLCVEMLISRIEASLQISPSHTPMPLYMVLISLISCVPLALLPRELTEVQKVLEKVDVDARAQLGEAVLEEIANKVGDREKEVALSWWCMVGSKLSLTVIR